jgi:hypothetical protein
MPTSSAWTITTRASGAKPSFSSAGFGIEISSDHKGQVAMLCSAAETVQAKEVKQ